LEFVLNKATRVNNTNNQLVLIVGVLILAPVVVAPLTADQCFVGLCLLET
jgi:hypothetical protein